MKATTLEPTLFILRNSSGGIEALVATHVDDLLVAATAHGEAVVKSLSEVFVIKTWPEYTFRYCGREIVQDPKTFENTVSMQDYAAANEPCVISRERRSDPTSPLTPAELGSLRAINGALGWLTTQGRPDLAFLVSRCQGLVANAAVASWIEANRVVKQAKARSSVLLRYKSFPLEGAGLACVSDASFGNMPGGRSQSGSFILLADRDLIQGRVGRFSLLVWRSGRQKRACRSTFGAETLALSDTADRGDFVRGLLHEALVGGDPRVSEDAGLPLRWVVDAKDLYDTLTRAGSHSTTEHRLAMEIGILRELLQRHD